MSLEINFSIDDTEKVNDWMEHFPEEMRIIETDAYDDYVTDWEDYDENITSDKYKIQLNDDKTQYRFYLENHVQKIIFDIEKFTPEVLNKIIDLYYNHTEIWYKIYDKDNNLIDPIDLITQKDEITLETGVSAELISSTVKYCDSVVFGLFLLILSLLTYVICK